MVDDLAGALARAIVSGDFQAARPLAAEYGKSVRTQCRLAAHAQERKRILSGALETLQDHLHLARIMRAHISARLQAVTGQMVYRAPRREQHTWRMEA